MVFIVFISISLYIIWMSVSLLTSLLWLDKEDTIAVAYCKPIPKHFLPVPGLVRSVKRVLAVSTLGDLPHNSLRWTYRAMLTPISTTQKVSQPRRLQWASQYQM